MFPPLLCGPLQALRPLPQLRVLRGPKDGADGPLATACPITCRANYDHAVTLYFVRYTYSLTEHLTQYSVTCMLVITQPCRDHSLQI